MAKRRGYSVDRQLRVQIIKMPVDHLLLLFCGTLSKNSGIWTEFMLPLRNFTTIHP